ncbi:hypothetical protein PIB30_041739 [Stylosanthes scabra]|uniref:Uncharacterized protein n=1 Tax=Stylosanthes scabra TaxID=79078 RepID=A0ABU6ZDT6_9FABA|nr:hypothetical protein [Stylosanthes scabra]
MAMEQVDTDNQSLASLSMHSRNEIRDREEEEVISKPTMKMTNLDVPTSIVKGQMLNTSSIVPQLEFVFDSRKDPSQISASRLSLKQQARKKIKRIVGVKRSSYDIKDGQCNKKQCSEDNFTAAEGEGATPQWAPKDP